MKKFPMISLACVMVFSSTAMASGSHSGGHGAKKGGDNGHWMSPEHEAARPNPIAYSKDSIQQGARLFQQNCASCHGRNADGKGMAGMMMKPRPADLVAMSGGHPDGDFAYKIKTGRGAMPGWDKTLNDTQVWHLVNYIQSLGKGKVVGSQPKEHDHNDGHGHSS